MPQASIHAENNRNVSVLALPVNIDFDRFGKVSRGITKRVWASNGFERADQVLLSTFHDEFLFLIPGLPRYQKGLRPSNPDLKRK